MKEIYNARLDEKYYELEHPTGLKILILPKQDYNSVYAVFGTRYGSIDTCFRLNGEEEFSKVPEGIAHFLEHKLFESEDLDAFERYAETGASANAYTSFDKTCYLFSTSGELKPSLEILLDFVQSPYFTKETVEKEQGIIGQEIRMYDDEPNWKVLFNLLCAMYHNNPVKIDIAGTVESIAEIDDKLLYKCYNTFYNLHNMALCIAGKVNPAEVLEIADELLKPAEKIEIERNFPDEPYEIVTDRIEKKLSVAVPVFAIGFKEECKTPERTVKEKIETAILLEILAGATSPLYKELFDEGLINTSFGSEYFTGYGYASVIFEGESHKPEAVFDRLKQEINRLKKDGIQQSDFERARKLLYGRNVMAFNDVEAIANGMIDAFFSSCGLFDEVEIFENVTVQDIERCLANKLDCDNSAISLILPA